MSKAISAKLFFPERKSQSKERYYDSHASTKGISAVIATIMLLMITVSLISVFYVFSSTIASQTTSSGSAQASQLTKQLSMCMQVDNIYKNQITLRNCGKGVIENKSLIVMMDDVKLGASTTTILEGNSSVVNISGLWQIPPGKHNLKISNGAAVAQNLVDVQPNNDGLVGRWSFDEGSGTMAGDGSGNNNIGTLLPSGSEPTWVSGKFNKGLQFDGTNDYVDYGISNDINSATDRTIEVWVNLKNTVSHPVILLANNGAWKGFTLETPALSSALQFGNGNGVNDWQMLNSLTSLSFNKWNHIVAVLSGTNTYIYINGILDNSGMITTYTTYPTANTRTGANMESLTLAPNGTIDEVRIWNRALAPDDTVVMKQII